MAEQKLTREQLARIIEQKTSVQAELLNQGGVAWRYEWSSDFLPPGVVRLVKMANRQINRWIYQPRISGLLNSFMLQARYYLNDPSVETAEAFAGSKADLRAFIVENLWKGRFRSFWEQDGQAMALELSKRIVLKVKPALRQGDCLRLQGLLEMVTQGPQTTYGQPIWYQSSKNDKAVEIVGGLDYDRLIGIRSAGSESSQLQSPPSS